MAEPINQSINTVTKKPPNHTGIGNNNKSPRIPAFKTDYILEGKKQAMGEKTSNAADGEK